MQNNQPTNRSKKLITASSIAGVVVAGALAVGTTLGLPTAGAQVSDNAPTTSAAAAEAPQAAVAPQDVEAFAVEDAGIVTVQRDGDSLVLVSVEPAEGWTYDEEVEDGEIEVEFMGPNGAELEFAVELRDGAIETYIEAEGEMPGGYESEAHEDEYDSEEEESDDEDDAEEYDSEDDDEDEAEYDEDDDHGADENHG